MNYAVVTGASKGLGASIAKKMIAKDMTLISVSRSENTELKSQTAEQGAGYLHYKCDLSSLEETKIVFNKIAEKIFGPDTDTVYLFNNAGVIEPIDTAGNLDEASILTSVQVNLTAPVLVSNLFLNEAARSGARLVVVNISSGAAERPVHGWSMYCSTKAALNMFTKTAAMELDEAKSNNLVIAFSPGIMDTGMQGTIRSSSREAFAEVETFQGYKEQGLLRQPDTVAEALVRLIMQGKLENGKIYRVNDLL
ncbi:(S)-benzoin forming benzil reductase [Mesobacillus harenae]|uniref:(S)-benzoin forming benzil reductase n=1 Tax=Mesobacillus harenae TaxID=2213203 RepID=UPI00158112A8|nr:(S)-benzoin forming benzil reductase [Mesobacillus harenae]